jgi:hypothetical protein
MVGYLNERLEDETTESLRTYSVNRMTESDERQTTFEDKTEVELEHRREKDSDL